MVITDQFVYIHMPKTGGTFVTEILKRLYDYSPPPSGFIGKVLRRNSHHAKITLIDKHGFCSAIPELYRHLPIAGCVRNPYDRYVSQFEFKWWLNYPATFPGVKDHANFPNLSFSDYIYLANERWQAKDNPGLKLDPSLGWHTVQFVNWYCKDPAALLIDERSERLSASKIRDHLYPKVFFRTNSLNQDLYDFLKSLGHEESQVEFIIESDKIMPIQGGRAADQLWQKYYSPELKEYVRRRERLLFELFPEFDE